MNGTSLNVLAFALWLCMRIRINRYLELAREVAFMTDLFLPSTFQSPACTPQEAGGSAGAWPQTMTRWVESPAEQVQHERQAERQQHGGEQGRPTRARVAAAPAASCSCNATAVPWACEMAPARCHPPVDGAPESVRTKCIRGSPPVASRSPSSTPSLKTGRPLIVADGVLTTAAVAPAGGCRTDRPGAGCGCHGCGVRPQPPGRATIAARCWHRRPASSSRSSHRGGR